MTEANLNDAEAPAEAPAPTADAHTGEESMLEHAKSSVEHATSSVIHAVESVVEKVTDTLGGNKGNGDLK
jgi:hypothetical protein